MFLFGRFLLGFPLYFFVQISFGLYHFENKMHMFAERLSKMLELFENARTHSNESYIFLQTFQKFFERRCTKNDPMFAKHQKK